MDIPSITSEQVSLQTILIATILLLTPVYNPVQAEETNDTKPLKEVEFLGLKLMDANLNSVRSHLWDVGGFLQAQTTVRQRNIDKFFPWSTIRDSYHVTFQYNHAGKIAAVTRLYRPYSTENNNQRRSITTKDIALQLIPELGQPTSVKRKGWGGGLSYPSYVWQDEDMLITLDREGSEKLGNIFVKYVIKSNKRYAVVKPIEDET